MVAVNHPCVFASWRSTSGGPSVLSPRPSQAKAELGELKVLHWRRFRSMSMTESCPDFGLFFPTGISGVFWVTIFLTHDTIWRIGPQHWYSLPMVVGGGGGYYYREKSRARKCETTHRPQHHCLARSATAKHCNGHVSGVMHENCLSRSARKARLQRDLATKKKKKKKKKKNAADGQAEEEGRGGRVARDTRAKV